MRALAPQAAAAAWVRFAEGANIADAMEGLRAAVADVPGAQVGGAAAERAEMKKILDGVVAVALALTAVAVAIAVVGIGNTLGLAVLERTREFGLLRALGLTRRRLRMMLGLEAVVLAAVAVLIGVGLGIAYGITGIRAVVGTGFTVIPEVPWGQLALVVAFALAAGWLASVLPGARAAKTSPSAALAEE
ncbi:ABC transporter permease [Mariniluteicoccus flavus]